MTRSGAGLRTPAPEDWYPDPADRSGKSERRWDGAAWTTSTRSATEPVEPPHWKRHPAAILRHRWFHVFLIGILLDAGLLAWSATRREAIVAVTLTAATATIVALAYGTFLNGRTRMREVIGAKPIILVAVIGGSVAFVIAFLLEGLVHGRLESALTGPIEEPAKLVVPLLLYAFGGARFRDPRKGLAIVLASAAGLGIFEDTEYMLTALQTQPHAFGEGARTVQALFGGVGFVRPLTDSFIHMSLTGMIAAVAWRRWWLRGGFRLTWDVIGAFAAAAVLHSTFDLIDPLWAEILCLVVIYLSFKACARWDVPPNAIAEVPPGWRPHHLAGRRPASPRSD